MESDARTYTPTIATECSESNVLLFPERLLIYVTGVR